MWNGFFSLCLSELVCQIGGMLCGVAVISPQLPHSAHLPYPGGLRGTLLPDNH